VRRGGLAPLAVVVVIAIWLVCASVWCCAECWVGFSVFCWLEEEGGLCRFIEVNWHFSKNVVQLGGKNESSKDSPEDP
jgi:hypothetical protein